ncbi:hypothetical protein SGRIM128S_06206 [Streptomyces griseomycini]
MRRLQHGLLLTTASRARHDAARLTRCARAYALSPEPPRPAPGLRHRPAPCCRRTERLRHQPVHGRQRSRCLRTLRSTERCTLVEDVRRPSLPRLGRALGCCPAPPSRPRRPRGPRGGSRPACPPRSCRGRRRPCRAATRSPGRRTSTLPKTEKALIMTCWWSKSASQRSISTLPKTAYAWMRRPVRQRPLRTAALKPATTLPSGSAGIAPAVGRRGADTGAARRWWAAGRSRMNSGVPRPSWRPAHPRRARRARRRSGGPPRGRRAGGRRRGRGRRPRRAGRRGAGPCPAAGRASEGPRHQRTQTRDRDYPLSGTSAGRAGRGRTGAGRLRTASQARRRRHVLGWWPPASVGGRPSVE